ncbi:MAG: hypothetical protein RL219_988 [Actinomycetota bacterium]
MSAETAAAAAEAVDRVWQYQFHPEVWVIVVGLVAAYVYMVRVIGPEAVRSGPVVTRKQVTCFVAAILMFWFASDWPMHDIAENYLYSVHMVQHYAISYFLAPLALLSIPEWMARAIVGNGRIERGVRFVSRPVVAGVVFNAFVMVTHIPGVVNASVENAPLHYTLHLVLVLTSLVAFMPVCGPLPELHMKPAGKMIYLFLESVVPTVPAAWLTFAEGTVYKHYNIPVRVWGLSVEVDQQIAGAIMKLGGSVYLWTIIGVIFFRHFVRGQDTEMRLRSTADVPLSGYVSDDGSLTYDEVVKAFRDTPAAPEPLLPSEEA